MEWLPHEVRYLIDSNVVRRFPDRLVPKTSKYYDWVTTEPRTPASIYPAEFDIDFGSPDNDSLGIIPDRPVISSGSIFYRTIVQQARVSGLCMECLLRIICLIT